MIIFGSSREKHAMFPHPKYVRTSGKLRWLCVYYLIITPSGFHRRAKEAPSSCVEAFIAMPFDMQRCVKNSGAE
jgi:hypothetical protein